MNVENKNNNGNDDISYNKKEMIMVEEENDYINLEISEVTRIAH